jgi:GNAT superfamily N-acetyltransferase
MPTAYSGPYCRESLGLDALTLVADASSVIEVRPLDDADIALVSAFLPLHRLGRPAGGYLVAWTADEPVGHAYIDWGAEVPELQDVFVAEASRRQGVATALTYAAEGAAAAHGYRALSLKVSEGAPAAIALYERLGYRRTADPPERVRGTVQLRIGPLEVDDVLLRYEKRF